MKRWISNLAAIVLALTIATPALAQGVAVSVRNGTTDPAQCQPTSLNVFLNRTVGALKLCTASNVWTSNMLVSGGNMGTGAFTLTGQTPAPTVAPTVALAGAGAGNCTNGTHVVAYSFITAGGQTEMGPASVAVNVTDNTADGKIAASVIAVGNQFVTGRNVYMSKAGTTTPLYLVAAAPVINNNTATTLTIDVADANLTVAAPTTNTALDTRATVNNAGQVLAGNGTAAAPSYAFTNFPDSGLRVSAGSVILGTNSISSMATLGTELLTNPTFAADLSSWTAGANWAWNAPNGALHTAGSVATLAQNANVTSGNSYQIAFAITGRTAGSIAVSLGAVALDAGGATSWTATQAGIGIVAGASGAVSLAITPTADFDGKLTLVSIKLITAGLPTLVLADNGATFAEARGSADNLGFGIGALHLNTTGTNNSAAGVGALYSSTTGYNNSAVGAYSLRNNTTGDYNSAAGMNSLYSNTTGTGNSAAGAYSLYNNTTGTSNSAVGMHSGQFLADGATALTAPTNSVFLGYDTRAQTATDANAIVIGASATGAGSNSTTIGNASTATAIVYGLQSVGVGSNIASAATIAPTRYATHITGITEITTITPPAHFALADRGGQIALIPDGAFTLGVTGNIAIASTAVVGRVMMLVYDNGTSKWYPSY